MAQHASGNYINETTPRWLSANNPISPPANITVSTMTVGYTGGIVMTNNNALAPNTDYAELSFVQAYSGKFTTMFPNISKNVPGQLDQEVLTMSENNSGIRSYDDFALAGIQIFGKQLLSPSANTGCAGLITQGSLPFSVKVDTGIFQTGAIQTGQIYANAGVFSTITVSSINGEQGGGNVSDPFIISSIIASSINSGTATIPNLSSSTGYISSLRANEITTSTLNISTFALGNNLNLSSLNVSTMNAGLANMSSLNVSSISSGTITAGVGTFSTLNAPGGSVAVSTVTTSSINTGSVSTITAVAKELFTSTMQFNASLSPNFDLGLGGIIGGLVGGFGANALGVGLGAAALGTGIAGLVMPRTSGGINSNVFQTVNGTSQLQYSTLGAVTQTTFVDTESLNPGTTPGFPRATTSFIPAGTYCMRTISDPLNLANNGGLAGDGIQGFSEWTPVYPGFLQVKANSISSILTGNSINLGESLGAGISILPAPGKSVNIQGTTQISTLIVPGSANIQSLVSPLINASVGNFSTLTVSTFAIAVSEFNTIKVSTLNNGFFGATASLFNTTVSGTLTTSGLATFGSIQVNNQANIFDATITNIIQPINGSLFTPRAYISSLLNVSSINGQPVSGGANPTGAIIAYAGVTAPSGWLICNGALYETSAYLPLYAIIGTNYGSSGTQFAVPDLRARTIFGASYGYGDDNYKFNITAVTFGQLQTEYSGTVVPANTAPNGLQAYAVKYIPPGFELYPGMRVKANSGLDQNTYGSYALMNYIGGSGTYTWPNFPVILLNQPLTSDPGANASITVDATGLGFNMGPSIPNITNFTTQTTQQVGNHIHGNKQGGTRSPIDNVPIDTTVSGAPTNASDQSTQGVLENRYYKIGASTLGGQQVTFDIPTVMPNIPSNLPMTYIIKT